MGPADRTGGVGSGAHSMIPIRDLLHRIRWDPAFGTGVFEIAYVDRVAGRVVRVPFGAARLRGGRRPVLTVVRDDGAGVTIPLHRVREVWRDGEVIWVRAPTTSRRD